MGLAPKVPFDEEFFSSLLGVHSQGYPNLFIMGGYQASFRFNLTDVLQTQGDEGEFQRRQDGNYNGSYPQYLAQVKDVGANIEENFVFTKR